MATLSDACGGRPHQARQTAAAAAPPVVSGDQVPQRPEGDAGKCRLTGLAAYAPILKASAVAGSARLGLVKAAVGMVPSEAARDRYGVARLVGSALCLV